jgi:GT2 family glycosyltransferase
MPKDLSICIVNYNTEDLLDSCLLSLYENTKGMDFEVIVVDNGSSDGSMEMLETRYPQVRLIRNNTNLYFTKANNQAIRASNRRCGLRADPSWAGW